MVVRELFRAVEHDVLVAGYALFNARSIFEPLAERMVDNPAIRARLVINVGQAAKTSDAAAAMADFRRAFRKHHWPDAPLPQIYHDPRAMHPHPESRAVMHATCVVVDGERCFLTSANYTEAAQARNVELGVIINDRVWARMVLEQFDSLIDRGDLHPVPMDQP